jgi:hypothetical protein
MQLENSGNSGMLSGQLSAFLGLPRGASAQPPQQQQGGLHGGLGPANASLGLPNLGVPSGGGQQLPGMLGNDGDLLANFNMPLNSLLF